MLNSYLTVAVLCLINLLNYMDRFTIAGVLKDIQNYFGIDNSTSGLLQTAFICSYMVFAPIFGFLGDRYPRKILIIFGVLFWSLMTLLSSYVKPHHTALFFLFRALVGVGEASYSTVAPTIIADLFTGKKRSTMIALFYFAIPVGSGLGYIVGSQMAKIFGGWEYALRFTPPLGLLSVIVIIFLPEPKRGAIDGEAHGAVNPEPSAPSTFGDTLRSLKVDFLYLISVPSFLHTTFGFTCVSFSIGALSWWAPYFMVHAIPGSSEESVNFIFGVIACVGGLVGVLMGSAASQLLRPKYPSIDPYICGVGILLSIPCAFVAITFARTYPVLAWINIFLSITFLSANWSVVVDILLYVIVPNRRSTAQAVQILISHILGDATSPFIIGAISSIITNKNPNDPNIAFKSLQYSLYLTPCVLVLGGFFFFFSARYLLKDEYRCKNAIAGSESALSNNDTAPPSPRRTSAENTTLIGNSHTNLVQRNVDIEYDGP